jgi:hypothetical protein
VCPHDLHTVSPAGFPEREEFIWRNPEHRSGIIVVIFVRQSRAEFQPAEKSFCMAGRRLVEVRNKFAIIFLGDLWRRRGLQPS